MVISIHTPARGVTIKIIKIWEGEKYFNPHSRKGSDNVGLEETASSLEFQSTLPQGE